MKKRIVVFFPCVGRRVCLLESFRKACKHLGRASVMVGADTQLTAPGLQSCDRKYVVRPVAQRGYGAEMTAITRKEKVDLVVPTVDLDLPVWAQRRGELARAGCTVLSSRPQMVKICEDKRRTFAFLREHGFDTPLSMTVAEALKLKRHRWPYFLKPWDGHASRGNAVVHNLEELRFYGKHVPNCLVQEFINGQEYTVDVCVDFAGEVRCVVPRKRLEVRAGEVSKGMTVRHTGIVNECKALAQAMKFGPGVTTIQLFLTKREEVRVIEINPRFGGGAPLSIKAGADFPLWIVQWLVGQEPHIRENAWTAGLMMLRYDEAVWRMEDDLEK